METQNVIRVALVLAAAMALAACGVANPFTPAGTQSSSGDQQLKWAQCMRQHGVNVPDPGNARPQAQSTAASSGNQPNAAGPNDPQFQAAADACKQYAPNGGNAPSPLGQQTLDQATKWAQCMRDHGIAVPDPNVRNGGPGMGSGGEGSNPINPDSDQFRQAMQVCAKYQPGGAQNAPTNKSNG